MRDFHRIANLDAAISRALNKTARTARAQSSKLIRAAGYGLPANELKKSIDIRPSTTSSLVAQITGTGRPIPLIKYGARAVKTRGGGVTVNVLHGRKQIRAAFIATMPSGHRGVFVRVGSAAHNALRATGKIKLVKHARSSYKHGLPIEELFGPSIPSALINEKVSEAMTRVITDRFPVVLRHELNFEALRR